MTEVNPEYAASLHFISGGELNTFTKGLATKNFLAVLENLRMGLSPHQSSTLVQTERVQEGPFI